MKPVVLKLARDDLREIRDYLSKFGENPPKRFRESFEKFCIQIEKMPYSYSQYESNPKYRRAAIEYDYLVFYQVEESNGRGKVYRVLHGKRDIKILLDED
ncbi:MAG: type II toxin-antitoxin system RelE/ParE family toxin [Synergistaceae bacterium]|nr:type II toxin-antitoxin system RelE/ParE family toxin [Synergistaceae bacterium]